MIEAPSNLTSESELEDTFRTISTPGSLARLKFRDPRSPSTRVDRVEWTEMTVVFMKEQPPRESRSRKYTGSMVLREEDIRLEFANKKWKNYEGLISKNTCCLGI